MTIANTVSSMLANAAMAKAGLWQWPLADRNAALHSLADTLLAQEAQIMAANQMDLAESSVADLPVSTQHRLKLTSAKWQPVISGLHQLARLPDPLNRTVRHTLLDDGLTLRQHTVPLGTLLVIFEARPDVLPQIVGLALKSGNVLIAKGGQETTHTNRAIMAAMQTVWKQFPDIHPQWVQLAEGRAIVQDLLQQHQAIDLVIPRGSNTMVQHIMASTRIPVLGHADGICHLYWHASAKPDLALATVIDAKTHYPSACNAVETLLLDKAIAQNVLPQLNAVASQTALTLLGCEKTRQYLPQLSPVDNWATEYADLTLALKLVDTPIEAIAHITQYGSHHTDGILAEDSLAIEQFLAGVDSANVYVNASTRFADGFRYGLGAEVGISTSRTHARGPVGLDGLVSTRWVLEGHYHTVASYTGNMAKPFIHKNY
jgi:glutamate-5-semialdehyde dehydrogenase